MTSEPKQYHFSGTTHSKDVAYKITKRSDKDVFHDFELAYYDLLEHFGPVRGKQQALKLIQPIEGPEL